MKSNYNLLSYAFISRRIPRLYFSARSNSFQVSPENPYLGYYRALAFLIHISTTTEKHTTVRLVHTVGKAGGGAEGNQRVAKLWRSRRGNLKAFARARRSRWSPLPPPHQPPKVIRTSCALRHPQLAIHLSSDYFVWQNRLIYSEVHFSKYSCHYTPNDNVMITFHPF